MKHLVGALLALLVFAAPCCAQEGGEIPSPQKTSIFMTIDYEKNIGTFTGEQAVFPLSSDAPEEAAVIVDISDGKIPGEALGAQLTGRPLYLRYRIHDFVSDPVGFSFNMETSMRSHLSELAMARIRGILFDFSSDRPGSSWLGHEEECTRLYGMLARSVKKIDGRIAVGGPGFIIPISDEQTLSEVPSYVREFAEFCSRTGVPCDFLYLNHYGALPYGYYKKPAVLKEKLLPEFGTLSPLYGKARVYIASRTASSDVPLLSFASSAGAMICAVKGGADVFETSPFLNSGDRQVFGEVLTAIENAPVQLETNGLDGQSLVCMAAKSETPEKLTLIVAGFSPSLLLLDGETDRFREALEQEYRTYVHLFSDGMFSPLYERYRISLEHLPWAENHIRMQRLTLEENGFQVAETRELVNIRDFYVNKTISLPAVSVITFESFVPEPKEETSGEEDAGGPEDSAPPEEPAGTVIPADPEASK